MAPKLLKSVLWSYDLKKIDLKADKVLIIKQIMNYGTKPATDWMFKHYSRGEIKKVFNTCKPTELDKKSYNFFKLILN